MNEELNERTLAEDYFTAQELAERWKTTTGYLANRRYQKLEPAYIKLGSKVLYPIEDILKYEELNKRQGRTASGEDEQTTVRDSSE